MSISSASELESSLVSFAGSDSTSEEREGGKRGEGGRLSEGGDYFHYFHRRGDYLREAINQGTAIIRGNRVVCPLNYKSSFFEHGRPIVLIVFSLFFKII